MKRTATLRNFLLLLVLLVSACSPVTRPTPAPTANATPTRTLPAPVVTIVHAPEPRAAVQAFFDAWKAGDYASMYGLLNKASRDALTQEAFTKRISDATQNLSLKSTDLEIQSAMTNPDTAQVNYHVIYHTELAGDLTRDDSMTLSRDGQDWRVQWDDGLILPELRGGNTLSMQVTNPVRGSIFDRWGDVIAAQGDIVSITVIAGKVNSDQEGWVLSTLSRLTGKNTAVIRAMYDNDRVTPGQRIPIGEVAKSDVTNFDQLVNVDWLEVYEYTGRYYPLGGVAPHITGYVRSIRAGEEAEFERKGYKIADRIPENGIEAWGDNLLRGHPQVSIDVNDPLGNTVAHLSQSASQPAQDITLTIDRNLQVAAQHAMQGFTGGLVVLERDTGRVLAMVSSPGFDPNAFEPSNANSPLLVSQYYRETSDPPFINRASGRGYAPGSVFKIVTLAAALESGLFQPSDTYDCQYEFTEMPDRVLYDWTKDKGYPPSGILTLPQGLMRSCDPWFYHIGLKLYNEGHGEDISKMARAFGFGSPTGLGNGLVDEAGSVPDVNDGFESTQLAIGQSQLLTNPLQIARAVAAVGNGGTLYRPQVVEKIAGPDGAASFTFQPEAQGTLPIQPDNLKIIQEAMRWAASSKRGTAVDTFGGFAIPVYGKTGTASTDISTRSHAWFAGYTNAGNADRPDIAFAVVGEYAGEGSEIAAPIARRLVEVYFQGRASFVFPWEKKVGVPLEPTQIPTSTPEPGAPPPSQPADNNPSAPVDEGVNVRTATPAP